MAAVFTFGGFQHDDDSVMLANLAYQKRLSTRGKGMQNTVTMGIWGEVLGSTTDEIISKAAAIINAYKDDYKDARMTINGTIAHQLLNGSSISGVRVINRSFSRDEPDELATVRTFSITLQATYDACEDDLVSWQESISITGTGGPKFVVLDTVSGPFGIYYTTASAKYYVQSGQAVGYTGYPVEPPPIITGLGGEFFDRRRINHVSGRNMGNALRFFTTQWSYYYVQAPTGATFLPTSQ